MLRSQVFEAINIERNYQDRKWGKETDAKNTPNDWIAYITAYAGKAYGFPIDYTAFRLNMIKVAALAVAALEQDKYPLNSLEVQ